MKFQIGQLVRRRRSPFQYPDWDLPCSKGIIVGLGAPLSCTRTGEREAMLKIQWFDDNAPSGWFPATRVVPLSE